MGFRLRGGRPKNMGQGIYWVQRHLGDQRAAARADAAAQRRVALANQKAISFNERYHRIVDNVVSYFSANSGPTEATPRQARALSAKIEEYNSLKTAIDQDIEAARATDLSRLATLARGIIRSCAKMRKQVCEYDAQDKLLTVDDHSFDFS